MFSSGSKYFLGISGLSLVAAIVYAFTVNPSDLGAIALLGVTVAATLLLGIGLHNNSGDAATVDEAVTAAAGAPRDIVWPSVFALGITLVAVGLATVPVIFLLGIVVTLAAGAEWLISNWSDRASVSFNYNNNNVRVKAIGPLEYPVAAALFAAALAYLFSRIMLNVSKETAPIVFIIVAALVLTVGFLVATKPAFRGRALSLTLTVGVLAVAAAGIGSAVGGERSELAEVSAGKFYSRAVTDAECGAEEIAHFDHKAGNTVNLRSAVAATITVENGKVYAQEIALEKKVDQITVARSNEVNILFRNKDTEEHRMIVHMGEKKVAETGVVEKVQTCTQLAGEDQEQLLTLKFPKPSSSFKDGYSIEVPGAEGTIKIVVPG